MGLLDKLRGVGDSFKKRTEPLWKGPQVDGVTFSMLSRFLVCRERFRVVVIDGLRPDMGFNHRIEYGQMWHACEETWANDQYSDLWGESLQEYCRELVLQYPMEREQITKWYEICRRQFACYVAYWAAHDDMKKRHPVVSEKVFNVKYPLPSGRVVRLRGKWDSVDLVEGRVWLQENKTKGDIKPLQLQRQLSFDLQTMIYLVSLYAAIGDQDSNLRTAWNKRIAGVRYNVVRRPLSGGKGSIVQKKGSKSSPAESDQEYYDRAAQYFIDEPDQYFMRWNIEVKPQEVERFKTRCLDPLLEQLCDWYRHVTVNADPFYIGDRRDGDPAMHWQHPFGVYNVLDEGGSTDLDEYLATGNRVGLRQVDRLFTELEGS